MSPEDARKLKVVQEKILSNLSPFWKESEIRLGRIWKAFYLRELRQGGSSFKSTILQVAWQIIIDHLREAEVAYASWLPLCKSGWQEGIRGSFPQSSQITTNVSVLFVVPLSTRPKPWIYSVERNSTLQLLHMKNPKKTVYIHFKLSSNLSHYVSNIILKGHDKRTGLTR